MVFHATQWLNFQVSRKGGIINRISDTVEDMIDSFSDKEEHAADSQCRVFTIKQLRRGTGDDELECTG